MTVLSPQYSNKQVVKAGKALGGTLPDDPSRFREYIELFRIAHGWRMSHAQPMQRVWHELRGKIRKAKATGISAARLKRMASIRRKLTRISTTLLQIEDIGGCRAIMDSMSDLNRVLALYRDGGSRHKIRKDRSYLDQPKPDGYRSHHLAFEFQPTNEEERVFEGRRIEIQIRTRLQHSWATAVEAMGLVRNEDLKAGEGNREWLRLFALVSAEYAESEGCLPAPGMPDKSARIAEIRELDRKLSATNTLVNLNQAFDFSHSYNTSSKYLLIQYNNNNRTVRVKGFNTIVQGGGGLSSTEEVTKDGLTSVLVEVDKVENLKAAYPNYFLDVSLFAQNLAKISAGQPIDGTIKVVKESAKEASQETIGRISYDRAWLSSNAWRRRTLF